MIIFLDSSVWIAATFSERGASAYIIQQVISKNFEIISSADIFEEVTRNLNKKYPLKLQRFLDLFAYVHAVLVEPDKQEILKATKLINVFDAIILVAAMEGNCEFFVTLDRKHFIQPKVMESVSFQILLPGDFVKNYLR